ncbi:UDP-glucose 4-epimerase GalE [Changchengzhania lutea]|uniref:UDP-glucose 4-epimerase GalE n=1 Tax=Changchengzhania lutea TaxID=2049305 RepID=UPI0037445979
MRINKITGVNPKFIKIDLKDTLATHSVFNEHKDASGVIHFVAHKAVGEAVDQPLKYYKNNFYSLLNTLEAQSKNGINNFIFSSSSATLYGIPDILLITEKNETQRPFSPYGNTKKVAEEILDDLIRSNKAFSAISLRYFNSIGAHESGEIGEPPNGIPNNLMPYITQTAVGIREKLMIYVNDYPTKDGTPIRDYIHIVDLAKAHVIAVERLLNKDQETALEFFNLGTGIGYSVLDVINAFEAVTNSKLNYEITGRRDGDVPQFYAATDLTKEKLGWTVQKGLDEIVSSSWNWEQNLRNETQ